MIFFSVILLFCTFVLLTVNILLPKFLKNNDNNHLSEQLSKISISIIVAAKNEEKFITRLLNSLKDLDYPTDNFEVIIIDDQSTDNTKKIVLEFIKDIPNFRLISSYGKQYPAKKGALAIGISNSKFDYILTTDADCVVPNKWLNIASNYFSKDCDIIFGLTTYIETDQFVNRVSSFEKFRGQLLTFLFAKLGFPYSASGGNFGFMKSSFSMLGGYEKIQQTLSGDDDLLVNEAAKLKMNISPIIAKDYSILTNSPTSWKQYFKQRARHTSTSIYYRSEIKILLAVWHLANVLILFSPFLIIYNWIFLIPFIIKMIFDIIIVKKLSNTFNYNFNILTIIPLQILYEILLIIHFVNSFRKRGSW